MTCFVNICNLTENILWVMNVKQMWTWISKAWKIMEQNSENLSSKFSFLEKAVQCCQFWGSWFRSRFSLNTTNPTIKSRASVSEIKKKAAVWSLMTLFTCLEIYSGSEAWLGTTLSPEPQLHLVGFIYILLQLRNNTTGNDFKWLYKSCFILGFCIPVNSSRENKTHTADEIKKTDHTHNSKRKPFNKNTAESVYCLFL